MVTCSARLCGGFSARARRKRTHKTPGDVRQAQRPLRLLGLTRRVKLRVKDGRVVVRNVVRLAALRLAAAARKPRTTSGSANPTAKGTLTQCRATPAPRPRGSATGSSSAGKKRRGLHRRRDARAAACRARRRERKRARRAARQRWASRRGHRRHRRHERRHDARPGSAARPRVTDVADTRMRGVVEGIGAGVMPLTPTDLGM